MDSPIVIPEAQNASPTGAGRRRTSLDSNSPEFEFWMVRNPSFPQPNLLSADELFVDGVLLPLHLLPHSHDPNTEPDPGKPDPSPPDPGAKICSSSAALDASPATPSLSASKRWRDIFKKGDKEKKNAKSEQEDKDRDKEREKDKDKEKKRERKSSGGGGGGTSSSAELNINIWPFSRSRSAGNACSRPKHFFGAQGPTRKVNSAPCSRSNSAGESKSRKWPSSPGRPGVHLGRSSPVWQVRRGGSAGGGRSFEPLVRNAEKGTKKDALESRRSKPAGAAASGGVPAKAKVLNLNVPMCMGYRSQLSCRSDENSALGIDNSDGGGGKSRGGSGSGSNSNTGGGGRGVGVGSIGSGGNLFNLRSLFTKKVY